MAPPLDVIAQDWRQGNYLVSTRRALIQYDAVNAAFDSDLMWWAYRFSDEGIRTLLDNSLCLGLYHLPDSSDPAGMYASLTSVRD